MHNLKTKIKKTKQNLSRGHHHHHHDPFPSSSSSGGGAASKAVEGEWQFVNFNPVVYGPKRSSSLEEEPVPLLQAVSTSSYHHHHNEDYYEFPTSTKLQAHKNGQHHELQQLQREKEAPVQVRGRLDTPRNKHLRHSLNSAFDLLSQGVGVSPPPPLFSPKNENPLVLPPKKKSTSPWAQMPSSSSSSSASKHQRPASTGNRDGNNDDDVPPILPPRLPSCRPHSWDSDCGSSTLVCRDSKSKSRKAAGDLGKDEGIGIGKKSRQKNSNVPVVVKKSTGSHLHPPNVHRAKVAQELHGQSRFYVSSSSPSGVANAVSPSGNVQLFRSSSPGKHFVNKFSTRLCYYY